MSGDEPTFGTAWTASTCADCFFRAEDGPPRWATVPERNQQGRSHRWTSPFDPTEILALEPTR